MNLTTTDPQLTKRCSILEGSSVSIVEFPSNVYVMNQIAVCSVNGLLIVVTVLLNVVAMLTIHRCLHLKNKTCYFLIFLQSGIDVIAGFVSIPLFTYVLASEITGTANCTLNFVFPTIAFIPMALSVVMLCGLSFERYMAVLQPLAHRTKITKARVKMYLYVSTFVILLMMVVSVVYTKLYYIIGAVNTGISLIFIAFFYTRIFQEARKRIRLENRPGNVVVELNSYEKRRYQQFTKEIKLARSCFVVIVLFLICFIPAFVVLVLSIDISPKALPKFRMFQSWAVSIYFLNHSMKSIIFFWRTAMLRKEAENVMSKIIAE